MEIIHTKLTLITTRHASPIRKILGLRSIGAKSRKIKKIQKYFMRLMTIQLSDTMAMIPENRISCLNLSLPTDEIQPITDDNINEIYCSHSLDGWAGIFIDSDNCPGTDWFSLCPKNNKANVCWDPWVSVKDLQVSPDGGNLVFCGNQRVHTRSKVCEGFDAVRFRWERGVETSVIRVQCGNKLPDGWTMFDSVKHPELACPPHSIGWPEYDMCLQVDDKTSFITDGANKSMTPLATTTNDDDPAFIAEAKKLKGLHGWEKGECLPGFERLSHADQCWAPPCRYVANNGVCKAFSNCSGMSSEVGWDAKCGWKCDPNSS